jgi:hypothetical protein
MNSQMKSSAARRLPLLAALITLTVVFILGCSRKPAATTAEISQATFATPSDAGHALQAAVRAKDESAIARILGPQAKTLVSSGDPAEDAAASESFAKKYDRMNRWVAMTDGSQVLYIGADNYPFPIPLTKDAMAKWSFNAAAADDELQARRIGRNELRAMDASRLIANAEALYHQQTHQYTDTIVSTPGKQDGLYWEAAADQTPSPLGGSNAFAKGVFDSAAPSKTLVLDGYSFRILPTSGQGAGFVVLANPVNYQHSGIMTFSLGRDGVIYQKDLGPQTAAVVASITDENPIERSTPAE